MNISNKLLWELTLFLLSGCSPQNNVSEQITSIVIPSIVIPSNTLSPTPTETPIRTATYTYSEVFSAYVDGKIEIDFDSPSREEYVHFSIAISEELNNRIEAPMSFSMNDGEMIYFDEIAGKVETISTIIYLKKKTELAPSLYIPAKQDEKVSLED